MSLNGTRIWFEWDTNLLEMLGLGFFCWFENTGAKQMGESHGISRVSQLISYLRGKTSKNSGDEWLGVPTDLPSDRARPPCGTGLPCPIGLVRHHRCLQRRVRRCPGSARVERSSCGSTKRNDPRSAAKMDGTKRIQKVVNPSPNWIKLAHFQLPYP